MPSQPRRSRPKSPKPAQPKRSRPKSPKPSQPKGYKRNHLESPVLLLGLCNATYASTKVIQRLELYQQGVGHHDGPPGDTMLAVLLLRLYKGWNCIDRGWATMVDPLVIQFQPWILHSSMLAPSSNPSFSHPGKCRRTPLGPSLRHCRHCVGAVPTTGGIVSAGGGPP